MKRVTLSIMLLVLMASGTVLAEDLTDRWGIGVDVGLTKLVGGDKDYASVDPLVGLWLRRGLTPQWCLDLGIRSGKWHLGVENPGEDADLAFDNFHGDQTNWWQGMIGVRHTFNIENNFNPYYGLHMGMTSWRVVDGDGSNDLGIMGDDDTVYGYGPDGTIRKLDTTNFTASLTLGAEYFFNESVSMDLGARYNWLVSNDLDNVGSGPIWGAGEVDANDGYVEAFLGLTYYFGGNKDKDGDGILNVDDDCPDNPEDFDGFQDSDGCPDLDNDGDGIADADDRCPDQAEDFDGFQDSDGCPDTDNDGDGIRDSQDACPDEAEDLDGYQDSDGCPDADNDGDGVIDAVDQCPDTPAGAVVDENGCPEAEARSLVLEDVFFEFNSANLTPESSTTLDEVFDSMDVFAEITVSVEGHTDSVGADEYNQRLSQARAETVMNYLAGKGIAASRMTAVGFGESRPVASNDTAEGRAQNRRVELVRTDR